MSEPKRHRHALTEAQQYESYKQSVFYEKAFNAGAAAQIEKDAARAETFVHDDWGKLMLECGKDIAAAIRDQLKP